MEKVLGVSLKKSQQVIASSVTDIDQDTHEIKNSIDFNKEGDLEIISRQTDFLGINYYSRAIIRSEEIPEEENLPIELVAGDKTDFEWEVYPDGLRDLLIDVDK